MTRQVAFLVGGRGTRLGALSEKTPKPLLAVAGRPFLDYLVLRAIEQGISQFLLLSGHLGQQLENYAKGWRARGVAMDCIVEPRPAGTGGALYHARGMLDKSFFLCNGDSLFAINLRDLATVGVDKNPVARLALKPQTDSGRYGRVEREGEQIIGFAEKGTAGSGIINGGVYLLSNEIFSFLPPPPCSLEQDVFPQLVAAGRIFGRCYDAQFIDIGVPEDLQRSHAIISTL